MANGERKTPSNLMQLGQKSNCRNSTQKVFEKHSKVVVTVQLRGNSVASLFSCTSVQKLPCDIPIGQ